MQTERQDPPTRSEQQRQVPWLNRVGCLVRLRREGMDAGRFCSLLVRGPVRAAASATVQRSSQFESRSERTKRKTTGRTPTEPQRAILAQGRTQAAQASDVFPSSYLMKNSFSFLSSKEEK